MDITIEEIKKLERDALGYLHLREQESILEGLNLSIIRKNGWLYILEPIEELSIEADAINLIITLSSNRSKVYFKGISNLSELVSFFGGIYKLSIALEAVTRRPLSKNHGKLMHEYISTIKLIVDQALEIAQFRRNYSYFAMVDHCALCWKSLDDSHFYCEHHHPESSAKAHRKAKRKLISALKSRDDDLCREVKELEKEPFLGVATGERMYRWVDSFAVSAFGFRKNADVDSINSFEMLIKLFFDFCRENYPHAYQKINVIEGKDFSSFKDLCLRTVFELSPIERVLIESKLDLIYLRDDKGRYDSTFNILLSIYGFDHVLGILRRYEAFSVINNIPEKRGPAKGSLYSPELRFFIREKMEEYEDRGEKRYGAKLARELEISTAYANRLIREVNKIRAAENG